ncbi:hypothetical protein PC9H_010837 [Pleurotus ostreatus]|uniref:Uncharacterized protein n=2 Tax=Pleurotus TaxID=5320 RepID=A0A8H7DMC6_PLEOS|nr:uncharacterized protein PC9H_010837 [Pleurotus ostreatus]KAF7422681.1 hypothetical protein PC9H_010837 [Pleurotus ostreatus]KAG9227470.1 hypothetical protein CCMSSC00406_0000884 [Pleurotus cornucopiae]KAJ8691429.1 hypothetical protein PTI98_011001 [Pleurotus ostreatus]
MNLSLYFFLIFLIFLVLDPQVAFSVTFADVVQCGVANVSFTGDELAAVAAGSAVLTILPFDSYPVSIPIPTPSANAKGVSVSFIPLSAGASFISSLEDGNGNNVGNVSEVMRILSFPNDATSCLPAVSRSSRRFALHTQPAQCQNFTVSFNGMDEPPSIWLFPPGAQAYRLRNVDVEPGQGKATFVMAAQRDTEAVLLFTDASGYRETSNLFSVGGDLADTNCLDHSLNGFNQTMMGTSGALSGRPGIPREAIIGIAAGAGGLTILVVLLMIFYIIRDRRKKHVQEITFHDAPPENWQSVKLPPTPPTAVSFSQPLIRNPPYVREKYASSLFSPRSTFTSWSLISAADPTLSRSSSNQATIGSKPGTSPGDEESLGRSSLSSTDIRQILDIAGMRELEDTRNSSSPYSARASHLSLGSSIANSPFGLPTSRKSSTTLNQLTVGDIPYSYPGRSRRFPDVPREISSLTLSALFPAPPADIPSPVSPVGATFPEGSTPGIVVRSPTPGFRASIEPDPYVEPRTPTAVKQDVPTDCGADGYRRKSLNDPLPDKDAIATQILANEGQGGAARDSIWYGVAQ